MSDDITASFHTLMEQGSLTAAVYLAEAIELIDEQLGDGYAERNPVLVGLFVVASAMDCTGAIIAQQTRLGLSSCDGCSQMHQELSEVVQRLESLADAAEQLVANCTSAKG